MSTRQSSYEIVGDCSDKGGHRFQPLDRFVLHKVLARRFNKKESMPFLKQCVNEQIHISLRPRIGFAHAHKVHEIISLEGVTATATGKAQQIMNITAGNARDVNAASDWHLSPKRTSTAVPSKQAY